MLKWPRRELNSRRCPTFSRDQPSTCGLFLWELGERCLVVACH